MYDKSWEVFLSKFLIEILLLFTAGNESCPQPQTSEHLAAIEIMKLKHILILQNKIDLVKESQAREQYDQILKFVQGKNIQGLCLPGVYIIGILAMIFSGQENPVNHFLEARKYRYIYKSKEVAKSPWNC